MFDNCYSFFNIEFLIQVNGFKFHKLLCNSDNSMIDLICGR